MYRHWRRLAAKHVMFWTPQCPSIRCILAVCLLSLLMEPINSTENENPPVAEEDTEPTATTTEIITTETPTTTPSPIEPATFVAFLTMEENPKSYIRFCDTDAPIYDDDKTCHAVAGIVAHRVDETELGSGVVVASGVFIDDRHVLTSYTPFRHLRKKVKRDLIYINYLKGKVVEQAEEESSIMGYYYGRTQIKCARQVVPMDEKNITEEQWHDPQHTHTPLHDLMIMQTNDTISFCNEEATYDTRLGALYNETQAIHSGPLQARLANANDEFPESFKIISFGFMDLDHVFNKNHLHTSRDYEIDDKVREDCEEWIPRDWGYFFCISNDEDFVGIGSGAILVDNSDLSSSIPMDIKVFGIGSFMLKKGDASILVFTDVRPYNKAISRTCNEFDGH